ncbi:alkaline phosphatase [Maribacter sp. 2307ULW6-5]|uniref:alkaline phosphatase n=1 Tax=Maribacter sp. 2307ULW6-5 TaxID=3386275 RepID=UPI0039BD2102
MMRVFHYFLLLGCFGTQMLFGQSFKVHSHNDYLQPVPFWGAYANGVHSIEIDVILKQDVLYVAHDEEHIRTERTLQSLYLDPLVKMKSLQLENGRSLQLLVDIKTEPYSTMQRLVAVLEQYPRIVEDDSITVVISGNRPKMTDYVNYPDFIAFDHQSLNEPENHVSWNKVALISLNFKKFTTWNGKGRLTAKDHETISNVIRKAHAHGKPFRFWAVPDSKTAWKAMVDLGVDFVNTDMPYACTAYLNTLALRVHKNEQVSEVYVPHYKNDGKETEVENIILLVGDGNGLAQISAAVLANGGKLTLTQFKSLGLLKTQSADDFTTDSAAAASALATGVKTNNRALGVNAAGRSVKNLTEILYDIGFVTGVITTDDLTGATPSAFYAHRKDRADTEGIQDDLLNSKLNLLIGGGTESLAKELSNKGFTVERQREAVARQTGERVAHFFAYGGVPSVLSGRGPVLAEATKSGLAYLKSKKSPFFLVVEASKIDTYGHFNDVGGIVSEGIDFDRAITEAVKYADATENTLVIVTADHETGGFTIPQGNMEQGVIEGDFTTEDHTGVMVPIFAYGPRSHEFMGVYDNYSIFDKILKVLNLD